MNPINWVTLSISNAATTGKTVGGVPVIAATLGLVASTDSDYFKLSDNTLTVAVPQNTPYQVTWLPASSAPGFNVTLRFVGLVLQSQDKGAQTNNQFTSSLLAQSAALTADVENNLLNLSPNKLPTGESALTSVNLNTLPSPSSDGYWKYTYWILFFGSDGNFYLLDPDEDTEH